MKKYFRLLTACMLLFVTYSCSNEGMLDDLQPTNNNETTSTRAVTDASYSRIYVLSEGVWHEAGGSEPGAITQWDKSGATFNKTDIIYVGDTGNDMLLIGDYLYCAVSGHDLNSNDGKILILDTTKDKLTVQDSIIIMDPILENRRGMPRHLATDNSKLYVTLYSGAVASVDLSSKQINTASLSGTYSEGICIVDNDLYICNSGRLGDTQAGNGTTISVLPKDFTSTMVDDTIHVELNPKIIMQTDRGQIFYNILGEYAMNSALYELVGTESILATTKVSGFDIDNSLQCIYTADMNWNTYETIMKKIDISTYAPLTFTSDPGYMFGFSVTVAPDGKVCYGQTMSDELYIFDNISPYNYIELATTVQNVNKAVFK